MLTLALFTHLGITVCSDQPPTFQTHQAGSKHQVPLIHIPKFRRHTSISPWILHPALFQSQGTTGAPNSLKGHLIRREREMPQYRPLPQRVFNQTLSPAWVGSMWWKVDTSFAVFSQFLHAYGSASTPFRNLGIIITFCFSALGLQMKYQDTMKNSIWYPVTLKTHHDAFHINPQPSAGLSADYTMRNREAVTVGTVLHLGCSDKTFGKIQTTAFCNSYPITSGPPSCWIHSRKLNLP